MLTMAIIAFASSVAVLALCVLVASSGARALGPALLFLPLLLLVVVGMVWARRVK